MKINFKDAFIGFGPVMDCNEQTKQKTRKVMIGFAMDRHGDWFYRPTLNFEYWRNICNPFFICIPLFFWLKKSSKRHRNEMIKRESDRLKYRDGSPIIFSNDSEHQ